MILKDNYLKEYPNVMNWNQEFQADFFNKMMKIIPTKKNLSTNQLEFLKETSSVFLQLDNLLSVFSEYDIKYTFGLAGGAIRDFVMDKVQLINDLDIYINFEDFLNINAYIGETPKNASMKMNMKVKQIFDEYLPNEKAKTITADLLSKLVNAIIEKNYKTKLFLSTDNEIGDYQNDHILGIIKIADSKLYKPMDIIISKDPVEIFSSTFSFDMCKGFIKFNENFKEKLKEQNGFLNLLDNIILSKHMVKDIVNKEYTMNLQNINEDHMHYYMNKHYLKMKEKYKDFKLNYRINKKNPRNEEDLIKLDNLEKLALYYIVENSTIKKEKNSNECKYKI
jgi:hypothetical protein